MPGFSWNSALNGEMISRFRIWRALSLNKTHLVISSIPIFFVDFLLTQHIRTSCQQRSQHQNFSAAVRSDQPGSLETWGSPTRAAREMGVSQNRGTRYPKSSKALKYSIENQKAWGTQIQIQTGTLGLVPVFAEDDFIPWWQLCWAPPAQRTRQPAAAQLRCGSLHRFRELFGSTPPISWEIPTWGIKDHLRSSMIERPLPFFFSSSFFGTLYKPWYGLIFGWAMQHHPFLDHARYKTAFGSPATKNTSLHNQIGSLRKFLSDIINTLVQFGDFLTDGYWTCQCQCVW